MCLFIHLGIGCLDCAIRRALLGEADATPAGDGRGLNSTGAPGAIGRAGKHRGGLGASRPVSPDRAVGWGGGGGQMDAQQQLQANRLDYNQAEIERRDQEIANIEQTVDGALVVVEVLPFSRLRSREHGAVLRPCVVLTCTCRYQGGLRRSCGTCAGSRRAD